MRDAGSDGGVRRRMLPMLAALAVVGGAVVLALAVTGDGDEEDRSPRATGATTQPGSRLATRIAELETRIAEYCEKRAGGGASAADDDMAADDARELIELASRRPDERLGSDTRKTVRDALADVSVVLRVDCPDVPFRRRVDQTLERLG